MNDFAAAAARKITPTDSVWKREKIIFKQMDDLLTEILIPPTTTYEKETKKASKEEASTETTT